MQELYNLNRAKYMSGQLGHNEFYCWVADTIKVNPAMLPASVDVIREKLASDAHLNNIPLALWDRRDAIIRSLAVRAGMRSWSLCDTVCTLKAFARRAAEQSATASN